MKLLLLLVIAAFSGGLFILSRPARAAVPRPVACPTGQTVFLVGRAQPGEALLLKIGDRVVGGGVADKNGRYRIPLRTNERPGIYPGAILNRQTRGTLTRFDCYVDVPLPEGAVATQSVPTAPPAPTETSVIPPPLAQPSPTQPPPVAIVPTVTPRPTQPGIPTVTPRPTQPGVPTVTPRPTQLVTSTPTPPVATGIIEIVDIQLRGTNAPREFVLIRNRSSTSAVAMGNWRLVNATRPADVRPFIFPAFTLGNDLTATIFSTTGTNDLNLNEFYWNQNDDIWRPGDVAELRDAANNLVFRFTVVQD